MGRHAKQNTEGRPEAQSITSPYICSSQPLHCNKLNPAFVSHFMLYSPGLPALAVPQHQGDIATCLWGVLQSMHTPLEREAEQDWGKNELYSS